jgi:hypothetical protein
MARSFEWWGDGRAAGQSISLPRSISGRATPHAGCFDAGGTTSDIEEENEPRNAIHGRALGLLIAGTEQDKITGAQGLKQAPADPAGRTRREIRQRARNWAASRRCGTGSVLSGGLGELIDRFKQSSQNQEADSGLVKDEIKRSVRPARAGDRSVY